jgi:23S rRNA (guanosine2251-2'-O)-methyltransferase
MAGNTERRGARRTSSKKGAVVGSGGKPRRSLEGRGPTPPGEARKGHPKQRAAALAAKKAGKGGPRQTVRRPSRGNSKGPSELIAGRNSVLEALQAEIPAVSLYVAQFIDADDRVREAMKIANDRKMPILEAPRAELDRLTDGAIHQGIALQIPPYHYAHPDDLLQAAFGSPGQPLIVALDSVTDPRNLGAVIRSVAAFGGDGVVIPERRAASMTAGAWKTSAGAATRVPVSQVANLTQSIKSFQKQGLLVVGLAADGEIELSELAAATEPLMIVVGSEDKGLSRLVAETCDVRVRIPMASGNESLNAGVAAGVVLYEVARRRAAS